MGEGDVFVEGGDQQDAGDLREDENGHADGVRQSQAAENHEYFDGGEREKRGIDEQADAQVDGGEDAGGEGDVDEEECFEGQQDSAVALEGDALDEGQAEGDEEEFVDVDDEQKQEKFADVTGAGVEGEVEQPAAGEHEQAGKQVAGVVVDDEIEPVSASKLRRRRSRRIALHRASVVKEIESGVR